MRRAYGDQQSSMRQSTRDRIDQIDTIMEEYRADGYVLTLRQLYYQLVARDMVENSQRSYNNVGNIVDVGRRHGMLRWDGIEDRTRNLESNTHWRDPAHIIRACGTSYEINKWQGQEFIPEVWIEKEALAGVFQGPCSALDVSFFSCRGYTSQSEMWRAGQRMRRFIRSGQKPVILHFGDHDPSGLDMSRDIRDRMAMFTERDVTYFAEPPEDFTEIDDDDSGMIVIRVALNMPQVDEMNPPPNPAKTTDCRYEAYRAQYGEQSWELDAIDPATMTGLINEHITRLRDETLWEEREDQETEERRLLERVSENWDSVVYYLNDQHPDTDDDDDDDYEDPDLFDDVDDDEEDED